MHGPNNERWIEKKTMVVGGKVSQSFACVSTVATAVMVRPVAHSSV
jgi:hypothetical protein